MKAKSRRRLLLSSVAMLLVAMLALGTATFAWFSTKTTADAKNVKVQTAQASSLVLSLDQTTWASEIDLAIDSTLDPASTVDLSNWFTATSTGYDEGTIDTDTIISATSGQNYIAKTFYIKSIGDDLDVDWSMVFDSAQVANDKNYMRAAMTIVPTTGGTASQVFWWSDDSVTTAGIKTAAGATEDVDSSNATTGQLASLTADEVYTINLYVWFEGQDEHCIDSRAGTVCDFDLSFAKRTVAPGP